MAQVRQVVSEALQSTVRRLLPSQRGFTEDLQASNVIIPIIDLTPTAEGSVLDTDLARAAAFGSETAFSANNSTVTVANTAGFYRIFAAISMRADTVSQAKASFSISDGLSTKQLFAYESAAQGGDHLAIDHVNFTVFLTSGDSVSASTSSTLMFINGTVRQVADVSGNLVNPSGFSPS